MKSQSFSRINVNLLNGKARNSFNIIENAGAKPRAFSVYLGFAPNSLVPDNFWLDTVVQFPFNFIVLKAFIISYLGNVKSISDFGRLSRWVCFFMFPPIQAAYFHGTVWPCGGSVILEHIQNG